jgi:hypothetical protein
MQSVIWQVYPKRESHVGRSRRRCVANITMDPKGIGWESADSFDLGLINAKWLTVVNTALKFLVP